ncbi:sigma-70 family RNA polymerase sigma factor [Alkalihalobacillus sp. R86527]|uniref:sigma-70 family RNA polymerase sigma factor n=1 Tax=Alkalihalobacillus sp. R86527 TaxID=3093863 RepID=UPI00366F5657
MEEKHSGRTISRNQLIKGLIEDYAQQVKRLAFTYVRNWAVADDITQEVFISCYNNIERFRGESSYKTWILKITVNRCKDYLKSKWYKSVLPLDWSSERVPSVENLDTILIQKHEEEEISKVVLSLPLKYREMIILFYYQDLSVDEINGLTGIKKETVKTRLRRAKTKFRELYEGDD